MQSENFLKTDLTSTDRPDVRSKSNKTKIIIWVHAITFLLGFALLVYVIYKIGYDKIVDSLAAVGVGFFVVLALNLSRHLGRAASLFLAIEPKYRTLGFWSVVAARFGGEAVNFFSFAGPFLGDATKAVLLKKDLPLTHGASAVIVDNILYYLSVILVVLAGVATLIVAFGSRSANLNNVLLMIVIVAVAGFAALAMAIKYSVTPFTTIFTAFERRGWAPRFLVRRKPAILEIETNVFQFYHQRRSDFFKVFAISIGVHALSVVEVLLALKFLGYDAQVSTAFVTESLTKVINVVFSFVPGTIGVYEGGNGIILQILGYSAAAGVTLALVRRVAILFSTSVGLVILLWRAAARGAKHLAKADS